MVPGRKSKVWLIQVFIDFRLFTTYFSTHSLFQLWAGYYLILWVLCGAGSRVWMVIILGKGGTIKPRKVNRIFRGKERLFWNPHILQFYPFLFYQSQTSTIPIYIYMHIPTSILGIYLVTTDIWANIWPIAI